MKVGIKLGKVKKFGIGWCIPHRMAADNAEGGSVRTPPTWYRVKVTKETMILEFSENILIKLICSYNKIYKNHMQQSVH